MKNQKSKIAVCGRRHTVDGETARAGRYVAVLSLVLSAVYRIPSTVLFLLSLSAVYCLPSTAAAQSVAAQFANLNNVRYAAEFAGDDAGAKIAACMADVPSNGGTCYANFEGRQTAAAKIALDRPVRLVFGAMSLTCSATPCFDITSGNLIIEGQGESTQITSASGGIIFQLNDSLYGQWLLTPLVFRNMELQGGGGSSRALLVPWRAHNDSPIILENIAAHGFGATDGAFKFGESAGFVNVRNSHFYENYATFSFDQYDELRIEFSEFYSPKGGPQIRIVGRGHSWIEDNTFLYHTGGTGTAPDIYIEAMDAAGNTGNYVRIQRNRFGPESEINGRYHIKIGAANNTYTASGPIWITENDFSGSPDNLQKAIGVTIPTGQLFVNRNQFSLFGTLIDDTVDLSLAGSTLYGMGTFLGNHHRTAGGAAWTTFTNGGRCFNKIELPIGASAPLASAFADVRHETPKLNNRFSYSEDFDSWMKTGVKVTAGQTDPFGGTRARLLTRAGRTSAEYVRANLDTTGQTHQSFFSIWLKAGTLTTASLRFFDNTASKRVASDVQAQLSSDWRKFKIPYHGLTPTDTYSVFILVGGEVITSGTIYAYGAQASDFDSDYYPSSGAAASTTAFGARFQNGLIANQASIEVGVAANGGGFKHARTAVTNCPTTGCEVTVTWGTAFADANYTPACSILDPTAQAETTGLRLAHLRTQSAAAITVDFDNLSGSTVSGTLNCIAVHD